MTTQPATSHATTVRAFSQEEAVRLLDSPEFLARWRALWSECSWSTALQTPEFACTWYRVYDDRYSPLLLVRYNAAGQLDGLFLLAVERTTNQLTFAGGHQSEYNVWLSLPGDNSFITGALQELASLGFASLTFRYLPPEVPLDWLESSSWKQQSEVSAVRRPLLTVSNPEAMTESLTKKKNRRRMEKLLDGQPGEFLELKTPEELDRYYDEIIDFCDFRQGAVHGSCPFRDDPHKRIFYRELMKQPGLMHVTVFKSGDRLFAAHLGTRSKDEVMLGVVAHSPFLSEHSPGKLLVVQLGLMLYEQGFSKLDLTPGGDAYKEDRATEYDEAHLLTVFLNGNAFRAHQKASARRSTAKSVAKALHLDRDRVERLTLLAKRVVSNPVRALRALFTRLKQRLWSTTEMRFYRLEAKRVQSCASPVAATDSLHDLLSYQPFDEHDHSRQSFLSGALGRIDSGVRPYTVVRDGVLVHYGWLTQRSKKSFITEVQHEYQYPPNSAVMWDFYTRPSHRGQGLYSQSMKQILSDAASVPGTDFIYIAVLADNVASRKAIERVGFQYHESLTRKMRFGRPTFSVGRTKP
jgi:CelD/BcsL family acetyltransferase involved in cellulose biosynthesis/GNAT superfamily N-acetyltransferase